MRVILIPGLAGEIPQSIRNYHHYLARELQPQHRDELQVHTFAPKLSGMPRDRRLRATLIDVARLWIVPFQLRRLRADAFHLLDHSHGAWVRALGPDRTVVTCHDLIPFARPEMWRTWWGRQFGRRMFTLNVRRMLEARAVIAVSAVTRRDIERYLGAPAGGISVVPNGVDREVFRPVSDPERDSARRELGLPSRSRVVLHVGTCDHYKNIGGLLRVFARARRAVPEALLVKAGAPFRPADAALIAALEIQDAVRHVGRLELKRLVAAYRAADALLYPSLYEGFGLPVLEAMACGTPVVASNTGAVAEVAGEAAVLCDPADEEAMAAALGEVLRSAAARGHLRAAGVRRAWEFGWDRTARLTRQCYTSDV